MERILWYIASVIVQRLEHEQKVAEQLRCKEVGIFFGDFYEPYPCLIDQYILGTTWKDFFEDVWEKNKAHSIAGSEWLGTEMDAFVGNLCDAAKKNLDSLKHYLCMELFAGDYAAFECVILDPEEGKMQVLAQIDG